MEKNFWEDFISDDVCLQCLEDIGNEKHVDLCSPNCVVVRKAKLIDQFNKNRQKELEQK